jgi:sulfite reductase (NADPH) flavoprotein alpha-component
MAISSASLSEDDRVVPLRSIKSSTFLTSQLLVQQVSFLLSDRIFSYSPDTYGLDTAVKRWSKHQETNYNGYSTQVHSLQTRTGAGSLALGYIFSPDLEKERQRNPQTILVSSPSLPSFRQTFDILVDRYATSSPLVAHVSAVNFDGKENGALVSDYTAALSLAEDAELALVQSISVEETQHMALFATLLANAMPTLHIYDGLHLGKFNKQLQTVTDTEVLGKVYHAISSKISSSVTKRASREAKASRILKELNTHLRTAYQPFEYEGHDFAETVVVVFGSVESSLAQATARRLAEANHKIGVILVRLYRPFLENSFLNTLPRTARKIVVLGQVSEESEVTDSSIHSSLYEDVLAAITFSGRWDELKPEETKYSRNDIWNGQKMAALFSQYGNIDVQQISGEQEQGLHIVTLNLDSLPIQETAELATLLGKVSKSTASYRVSHSNALLGGVTRANVLLGSTGTLNQELSAADILYVQDESILRKIDLRSAVKPKGTVLLQLQVSDTEELEKKTTPLLRHLLSELEVSLVIVDSSKVEESLQEVLLQIALLAIGLSPPSDAAVSQLHRIAGLPKPSKEVIDSYKAAISRIEIPGSWNDSRLVDEDVSVSPLWDSFVSFKANESEGKLGLQTWTAAAKTIAFKEAYHTRLALKPDLAVKTFTVKVKENRRLTPGTYDRNIFHIEFDLGESGLKYDIGEALGIHGENDALQVSSFIDEYGLNGDQIVHVLSRESGLLETKTVFQALSQNIDIFGRPPKRFYEALAEFSSDEKEKKSLLNLSSAEGSAVFKRRADVDTVTFADTLLEFRSARPEFDDLIRIISPMKRREYSIASSQVVTPTSVALLIVVVDWIDPKGRERFGQCSRYLSLLRPGSTVTVSVKPSVMKLPTEPTQPLIMAGLGTGLAPFRAFVQYRAWQKAQGIKIGSVLLYMGSRHQREEYLYGEEWEAYQDAGVITLLGRAFSRDQPQKIYIQDRMRETLDDIAKAYLSDSGSFYLCGPTWPVPDVTAVLEEAIAKHASPGGKKIDTRKEIERLKEELRYVLEGE